MITSKNTSINKNKLPASTRKINWEKFRLKDVLDYGAGKYNNLKDYLIHEHLVSLYCYDPYNRTDKENSVAMEKLVTFDYSLIICNNVLNVIESEKEVRNIILTLLPYSPNLVFSVYEGDKSGIGKQTKKDCWQRNERLQDYLKYFPENANARIEKGLIIIGNSSILK